MKLITIIENSCCSDRSTEVYFQIPTGVRDYNQGPGPAHRNNGHNMDVIDTTLRLGMASSSREKLNPKHGFDEEQVGLEASENVSVSCENLLKYEMTVINYQIE